MPEAPLDPALIGKVLTQAVDLLDLDDSARAEVWASGALGLWREPGVGFDRLLADRQLVDALGAAGTPSSMALALALSAVGPGPTRERAAEVVQQLRLEGVVEPAWGAAVGTARASAGVVIADPDRSDRRTVILEFVSSDGSHTLLGELDGPDLVDLSFGPPLEELLAGLAEPGADELLPVAIDAATLAAEMIAAWGHALGAGVAPTESWIMDRCVGSARLELFDPGSGLDDIDWPSAETPQPQQAPEVDPEIAAADAAALAVLLSALSSSAPEAPPPSELQAVVREINSVLDRGEWPAAAIAAEAALGDDLADGDVLAACAGAFVTRRPRLLAGDEADAVGALEWADWLGSVIELVRSGVGTRVTPGALVDNVNRCPEVSSAIPRADREFFERAFGLVIDAWRCCGFVDSEGRLSSVGAWALPEGLKWAWSDHPQDVSTGQIPASPSSGHHRP